MEDFPTRIADLLETFAAKVRAMTVDRIAKAVVWTAAGTVLAMLGLVLVIFLLVALFRLLGELAGYTLAYAIVGGLFLVVGAFLWSKRTPKNVEASS